MCGMFTRTNTQKTTKWGLFSVAILTFVLSLNMGCSNSAARQETDDKAPTVSKNTSAPASSAENDAINLVHNGFLSQPYNTTTVGKALEGTFQNGNWKYFTTPKEFQRCRI